MSAPELLYGRRRARDIPVNPTALDLDDGATVVLEDAQILYLLYEMKMSAAEALLPVSLHPSVPAVLGVTFIDAPVSEFGAFRLAYAGIACRTGIKPRHFIQCAFTDNADAGAFFARRYGFDTCPAAIAFSETYDRARGAVSVDGETVLDLAIVECVPLIGAGATIKYSPPLNAGTVGDGAALIQFEAAYEFKRAMRGRTHTAAFEPGGLAPPGFRPTTPIAGSHAVVDLHLLPARFEVDLETPAEAGGARKIRR
ncbi:MAG: acetoacetate decarboxylase family protein [Gammaproteobacteria bacterium]